MIRSGCKKLFWGKRLTQFKRGAAVELSTKATAPAFHYQPLFDLGADTTTEYKRLDKVNQTM